MRSNEEFKATVRRRCADLRQKRQRKRRLLALVMPAVACLAAVCLLLPSLLNHWPALLRYRVGRRGKRI